MASKYPALEKINLGINSILYGKSSIYQIKRFLGQGGFGRVAQCIQLGTKKEVAVKIVNKNKKNAGEKEVNILKYLKKLDEEKNNLIKCTEHFMHQGHVCLVFEVLDMTLEDLIEMRDCNPLPLCEISVITQQLLVALNALKSIHLVHADIKPNNVMLVNHQAQPFKLKLIDFGMATPVFRLPRGKNIQIYAYRAPEVILGLQLNEAIDMWSLGCVLAYLYLGYDLFSTDCENEVMRDIVLMLGQPDDHLLNSGIYTGYHFRKDHKVHGAPWKLKVQQLYGIIFTTLDELVTTQSGAKDVTKYEDTLAFLSLLKHMLRVDPEKRITPREALGHTFITMKHLYYKSNTNVASLDDSLSAVEETDVDTNNGPPATATDDTTAAGTNKKLHAASPASVHTTGFVEVKTRKKCFKRIRRFFSRMINCGNSCRVDVIE